MERANSKDSQRIQELDRKVTRELKVLDRQQKRMEKLIHVAVLKGKEVKGEREAVGAVSETLKRIIGLLEEWRPLYEIGTQKSAFKFVRHFFTEIEKKYHDESLQRTRTMQKGK